MSSYPAGRNMAGLDGTTNLIVQIGHGVAARAVTAPAPADLTMTWSAPGGDDTCSFTLDWPGLALGRPDCLTQGMPVRVADRRTGEVQWQGRVVDPGLTHQGGAYGFQVNAVGMREDLERIATVKSYVDRDSASWYPLYTWKQGPMTVADGSQFTADTSYDAVAATPGWALEFPQPQNSTANTGSQAAASYLAAHEAHAGLPAEAPLLYHVSWSVVADTPAATLAEVLLGTTAGTTVSLWSTTTWPTTQFNNFGHLGLGTWTTDVYYYTVRWERTGANVTQVFDHWLQYANLISVSKRFDRYGVLANDNHGTSGTAWTTLLPSDVVEDMLGTMLAGRFTPGRVDVDAAKLIDQASWYKGIDAKSILDYLLQFDADSYWAVWAPATPDGLPRLEWRKWGTTPRYVLDAGVDYTLAGGADQWASSALVGYAKGNGRPGVTRVTVDVPALDRIFPGQTRDIVVDYSDRGAMDSTTAATLGIQALANLTVDRNSGTANVTGAIMDDAVGRLVQPWEIRPGSPVRIGATPQQYTDGLPLTYDGQTTFKLSQVTYSASSNSAELSFDGGARTLFKAPRRRKPIIHPAK